MSRIFWDANIFIYLLEGQGERAWAARRLRERMQARHDQLFTSALALGEILVKPKEKGEEALSQATARWIAMAATVLGFEARHAGRFAELRRERAFRAPDAVHLACAAVAGMDLFVTADAHLQGRHVPGIQFIVPLERVPL